MYKRTVGVLVAFIAFFASASNAYAIDTWHLDINRGGSDTTYNLDDPATGEMHVLSFDIHTGYYQWLNPALFKSYILDPYGFESTTSENSDISALTTTTSGLQSQINGLSLGGSSFNVTAFMANQASTTPLVASSTFNGFMSSAMLK